MARVWVTNGTPTIPGILNPLTAACDNGYIPDEARILSNPGVADSVDAASEMFDTTIDSYGGDAEISRHSLTSETDFPQIIEFYRSAIEAAKENGDTIAIDVTPVEDSCQRSLFKQGFGSEQITSTTSFEKLVAITDNSMPKFPEL